MRRFDFRSPIHTPKGKLEVIWVDRYNIEKFVASMVEMSFLLPEEIKDIEEGWELEDVSQETHELIEILAKERA